MGGGPFKRAGGGFGRRRRYTRVRRRPKRMRLTGEAMVRLCMRCQLAQCIGWGLPYTWVGGGGGVSVSGVMSTPFKLARYYMTSHTAIGHAARYFGSRWKYQLEPLSLRLEGAPPREGQRTARGSWRLRIRPLHSLQYLKSPYSTPRFLYTYYCCVNRSI